MAEAKTEPSQVTVSGGSSGLLQQITVGRHQLVGDEPAEQGGADAGPNPYDFLLAALGTCTSMTVSLYARRKGWPLEGVKVHLMHSKVHALDCASCETREGMLDRIDRGLELAGPLSDEQRGRLLEIAQQVPGPPHPHLGDRHPDAARASRAREQPHPDGPGRAVRQRSRRPPDPAGPARASDRPGRSRDPSAPAAQPTPSRRTLVLPRRLRPPDASRAGSPWTWLPIPHVGLQTVSWLLEGEVVHHDSLGLEGRAEPGVLNLMTAGRGIAHAEETPPRNAGRLRGVQLWVALPERDRDAAPAFEQRPRPPPSRARRRAGHRAHGRARRPAITRPRLLAHGGRRPLRPRERAASWCPSIPASSTHSCRSKEKARLDDHDLSVDTLYYLGCGRRELVLTSGQDALPGLATGGRALRGDDPHVVELRGPHHRRDRGGTAGLGGGPALRRGPRLCRRPPRRPALRRPPCSEALIEEAGSFGLRAGASRYNSLCVTRPSPAWPWPTSRPFSAAARAPWPCASGCSTPGRGRPCCPPTCRG